MSRQSKCNSIFSLRDDKYHVESPREVEYGGSEFLRCMNLKKSVIRAEIIGAQASSIFGQVETEE